MQKQIYTYSGQIIYCADISRVQQFGDNTYFYMQSGIRHRSVLPIDSLLIEFPNCFVKLSEHLIININSITKLKKGMINYLVFTDGYELQVSSDDIDLLGLKKKRFYKSLLNNVIGIFI